MIFRHLLNMRSHPTWVRGLKHIKQMAEYLSTNVAPYVGAWIETISSYSFSSISTVAPYVGAWIETSYVYKSFNNKKCRTLRGCVD